MSEAAYRGLRDLSSLRSPEFFRTWMTRIVVNCAIDFLRKDSRLVSLDDTAPEPVEVADTALQCEDTLDLYDALDVLTERDKTCVTLRFLSSIRSWKLPVYLANRRPPSRRGSTAH